MSQPKKHRTQPASTFPTPSWEDWITLVEKQLGEGSYSKRLCKITSDGLQISPLYRQEDISHLKAPKSLPGEAPYLRGTKPGSWSIAQNIAPLCAKHLNSALLSEASIEIESVLLKLDPATRSRLKASAALDPAAGGTRLANLTDYQTAFDNLDLTSKAWHFDSGAAPAATLSLFAALLESRQIDFGSIKGSLLSDPCATFLCQAEIGCSWDELVSEVASSIVWANKHAPNFRCFGIDARPYLEASGNAIQQIAYAGATLIDNLRGLNAKGISFGTAARSLHVHFGVGPRLFPEIAKFRAFRMIWAQIINTLGAHQLAGELKVFAHCSKWSKTRFDPHTNLLRNTTEALSAVLGGVDYVNTLPFNDAFGEPNNFSRRIARNTQIILREECHLDQVTDPVGGSYYIEHLSDEFAKSAWSIIQEIENQGGMQAAIRNRVVQKQLSESYKKTSQGFERREPAVVGTSMFVNLQEAPLASPSADLASYQELTEKHLEERSDSKVQRALSAISDSEDIIEVCKKAAGIGATAFEISSHLGINSNDAITIEKIYHKRPIAGYESLRDNARSLEKKLGELPLVQILGFGPLAKYSARLEFAQTFLEPCGFALDQQIGIDSINQALKIVQKTMPAVVTVCSDNDSYPELIPELAKRLKRELPKSVLVVAGYLESHAEEFKASGVDCFFELRTNHLEFLEGLHQKVEGL